MTKDLARQMDKYIIFGLKRRFRVKDYLPPLLFEKKKFDPEAPIIPGMLDTDEIHLNEFGNRALIQGVIGSILQKWLAFKGIKAYQ